MCLALDLVFLAWTCSFVPRKTFLKSVCSNLNFSGLLLKCQHFCSTAQHHQERAGTPPSASTHISPPMGPWDRQDLFSLHCVPMCSLIQLFLTFSKGVFFFCLSPPTPHPSSWTLIMNTRSLWVMSIIQWLSSCSPCCWPIVPCWSRQQNYLCRLKFAISWVSFQLQKQKNSLSTFPPTSLLQAAFTLPSTSFSISYLKYISQGE